MGTAIGGFGFLILNLPTETKDTTEFWQLFSSRLSVVILIEIFAYFFLGLYKTGLNEIKYFQNEITNLEGKHLALDQAIRIDDKKAVIKILELFSATERNFILKKGESTISLETEKINQKTNDKVMRLFEKLISRQNNEN
jgi:hypothetical protein